MFGEHWVRLFKETGDKGYGRVIRRGSNINGQQIKKKEVTPFLKRYRLKTSKVSIKILNKIIEKKLLVLDQVDCT